MKIDLAQTRGNTMSSSPVEVPKENEPYYPCAYVSGVENLEDLKDGQEFPATVRVKGVTKTQRDGKTTYSADLEIISIEGKGGDKKSSKKPSTKDDEEAIDKGLKEVEGDDDYDTE